MTTVPSKNALSPDRRTDILGSQISADSKQNIIDSLEAAVSFSGCRYVCASNVHTVVEGLTNPALQAATNGSFRSVPDGKPLWWVQKLRGEPNAEHLPGPELFEALLARGEKTGHSHYFFGGTPEAQTALLAYVARTYPKTRVAGYYSPPFRPLTHIEQQDVVNQINAANADFVWVGLGAPKQEIWMTEHAGRVSRGVLVGVGAAFNFLGGTVKRAPRWMQKVGLEWLYRTIQEPRLVRRYIRTNLVFLLQLPIELIRR